MLRHTDRGSRPSARVRRWVVRVGVACLVLEVVYLIIGNLCIRAGVLEGAITDRPDADLVSWASGVTLLPGLVSLEGLTYRGQSENGQMYVHLAEFNAWISLPQLLVKRLHIRGARGRDLDYRYRERIDYPCWSEENGEPFPGVPEDFDAFPEIPGLDNPPQPTVEGSDPQEPESAPWQVKFSEARIRGAIHVAYNAIRLDGEGTIAGGMTIDLGERYAIDEARVRLTSAVLRQGPRVVTDDLALGLEARVEPFPGGCTEESEVISGISASLTVAGRDSNGFTLDVAALQPLLPGQGFFSIESGSGELGGRLEVVDGNVVSGDLDLVSDDVVITHQEVPLHGDLEVHATLREKNLIARRFDVTGTIFRLDDITETGSSAKQKDRLEPWFCHLEVEEGVVTLGRPLTLDSRVRLTMHDTRPVLILLRKFTDPPKWLRLTRNAKGIDGTMDLDFGKGFVAFNDLRLTGEDVEILGWLDIRNTEKNGRIYTRHGHRAAGVAFDGGEGKVVLIGPRRWFDKQPGPPSSGATGTEPESR